MLLFSKSRNVIITSRLIQTMKYSSLPKQAAGRFTSNQLINESFKDHANNVQKTLVYIGKTVPKAYTYTGHLIYIRNTRSVF